MDGDELDRKMAELLEHSEMLQRQANEMAEVAAELRAAVIAMMEQVEDTDR